METNLNPKMFADIIAFSFSEPGAMGPHDMTFYRKSGESFRGDYLSDETPYSMLKDFFPVLHNCCWNGPMKSDLASLYTVVIGGGPDDPETCVAKGWQHIYLDYGNHLTVKQELYGEIKRAFAGRDNCSITFSWDKFLKDARIAERYDEIVDAYLAQRRRVGL